MTNNNEMLDTIDAMFVALREMEDARDNFHTQENRRFGELFDMIIRLSKISVSTPESTSR